MLGQVEAGLLEEGGAGLVVGEELVRLLVALADAGDVARQLVRGLVVLVEVFGEAGAVTAAQDEASCVVFGMPREAIAAIVPPAS